MDRCLFFLVLFFAFLSVYSQDIDENIKTQQITVSKSYTPELSDITKIRSLISINDMLVSNKVTVTYSLIEVPVVSTFIPKSWTSSRNMDIVGQKARTVQSTI